MSRGNREKKVWLEKTQVKKLEQAAQSLRDRCIVQLGAWVGLRANEIARAEVKDLKEYSVDGKIEHFLDVYGKQTQQKKGEGKKKGREAYVPDEVYSNLILLKNENNSVGNDPLIPGRNGKMSVSGVRYRVYTVAKNAYERYEDQDFKYVSSHDLRRFFANYNLVEKGKNPRVVMSVGGWESWEAIKPYLDKPSRKTVASELSDDLGGDS